MGILVMSWKNFTLLSLVLSFYAVSAVAETPCDARATEKIKTTFSSQGYEVGNILLLLHSNEKVDYAYEVDVTKNGKAEELKLGSNFKVLSTDVEDSANCARPDATGHYSSSPVDRQCDVAVADKIRSLLSSQGYEVEEIMAPMSLATRFEHNYNVDAKKGGKLVSLWMDNKLNVISSKEES
jgi:hypothetical protein